MRKLLALGFLVGACSSVPAKQEELQAGGGDAASDRRAASSAGSGVAASATSSADANSTGGTAGEASAGSVSTAGAGTTSASGGQITKDGAGGASASGSSAGGASGTPAQAGATQGGMADGGDSSGGGGGAADDPCEGVAHWSPTDKITDYTPRPPDAPGDWLGDLRVFGGILWAAQATEWCQTFPGHDGQSGWIEITTCAGGPVAETAACQCAAGACCDGCYLRGQSYFCGEVVRAVRCTGGTEEGDYWNLFCDGLDAGNCTGWGAHTKYAGGSCASGITCQSSSVETACGP